MKVLLTSSKTMDFQTPLPFTVQGSEPVFTSDARLLRSQLAGLSSEQIQKLQSISKRLADTVVQMNVKNDPPQRPALWAYKGDVYKGFRAYSITSEAAAWANTHIRIPSGLYGLVRPYDLIEPYRLEMKTKLALAEAKDLYSFWGNRLAQTIDDQDVVVLASDEYARAVVRHLPQGTNLYDISFIDQRGEREVKIPIYNKLMRGVAARWLADCAAKHLNEMKLFSDHGYSYSASRSSQYHFVFYRRSMQPLVFS